MRDGAALRRGGGDNAAGHPLSRPAPKYPMAKHRFHEIDLLRGIACLMVVLYHYLHRGQAAGWIATSAEPWADALARYGYLGVHLFFIISGFVIFMSAEGGSARQFAASRVARLYPAFWVAAPLTAAVAWLFHADTFTVGPGQLLVNLTMAPHWFGVDFVDGAYWSLAVELQFYLLVGAALSLGWLHHAERLVAVWLLVAVADAWRPMWPVEFWLAAKWAPLFCAGICAYRIRTQGASAARFGLFAVAYLLALYQAIHAALWPGPGESAGSSALVIGVLVTAFHALFVAIAFGRLRLPSNGLAVWAGLLTYPVYLLHQNIGYVLLAALQPFVPPLAVRVLIVIAVVVAAAWAAVRWIERPLARRLRRWIDAPPVRPATA